MSEAKPPIAPKISERDRRFLRERVSRLLKERSLSQRRAEKAIGVATGTLSKIFAGKMALTQRLLFELATILKVTPDSIVEDTAYAQLLKTAVETPETELVAKLRAEVDALRVEKGAADAALKQSHEELSTARRLLAETTSAGQALEARVAALEAELAIVQSEAARMREEADAADQRERAATTSATSLREAVAASLARVLTLTKQVEEWRNFAHDNEQRAKQLEEYAGALQGQLTATNSAARGAAVGSGLLAFILGMAAGSRSA